MGEFMTEFPNCIRKDKRYLNSEYANIFIWPCLLWIFAYWVNGVFFFIYLDSRVVVDIYIVLHNIYLAYVVARVLSEYTVRQGYFVIYKIRPRAALHTKPT